MKYHNLKKFYQERQWGLVINNKTSWSPRNMEIWLGRHVFVFRGKKRRND